MHFPHPFGDSRIQAAKYVEAPRLSSMYVSVATKAMTKQPRTADTSSKRREEEGERSQHDIDITVQGISQRI